MSFPLSRIDGIGRNVEVTASNLYVPPSEPETGVGGRGAGYYYEIPRVEPPIEEKLPPAEEQAFTFEEFTRLVEEELRQRDEAHERLKTLITIAENLRPKKATLDDVRQVLQPLLHEKQEQEEPDLSSLRELLMKLKPEEVDVEEEIKKILRKVGVV